MKYICQVYFPPGTFAAMSEAEGVKLADDSIDWDLEMMRVGHMVQTTPLQGPEAAVTISVRDGKPSRTDGPYAETKEQIAGFFVVEATDKDGAIAIAEQSPVAKFGFIDVRPMLLQTHSRTGAGRPA